MACGDFKDINRKTGTDKVLQEEAPNFAKKPEYNL